MTEKEKRNDNILIGIIIGVVLYSIVLYLLIHVFNIPVR
jgi:tetrahydromethanopterin S-methyltransferase subunit G